MFAQLNGFGSQWEEARLLAFAPHTDLRFGQEDIVTIQIQHFFRPQPFQQHQSDDGQVARGSGTGPEPRDFVHRQRPMVRLGVRTRMRLTAGRGLPRPIGVRRQKIC
jgi:hypothetical protein